MVSRLELRGPFTWPSTLYLVISQPGGSDYGWGEGGGRRRGIIPVWGGEGVENLHPFPCFSG